MSNLEFPRSGEGAIERFGMSSAISLRLTEEFETRGEQMALVALAALTETPHVPIIGGVEYSVPVTNRHRDSDEDTVDIARDALDEGLQASAEGMSGKSLLWSLRTHYDKLYKLYLPSRRDGKTNRQAFDEVFVSELRHQDVQVPDPETGLRIIRTAPRAIVGLALRVEEPASRRRPTLNEMVTIDGRIVTITTHLRTGFLDDYLTHTLPSDSVSGRGGRAPQADIASRIKDRIVYLRTAEAVRR